MRLDSESLSLGRVDCVKREGWIVEGGRWEDEVFGYGVGGRDFCGNVLIGWMSVW